jgi:hypothetical protein
LLLLTKLKFLLAITNVIFIEKIFYIFNILLPPVMYNKIENFIGGLYMRLIDANRFQKTLTKACREPEYQHEGEDWRSGICLAGCLLDQEPTVDSYNQRLEALYELAQKIFDDFGTRLQEVDNHPGMYVISEAEITDMKHKFLGGLKNEN